MYIAQPHIINKSTISQGWNSRDIWVLNYMCASAYVTHYVLQLALWQKTSNITSGYPYLFIIYDHAVIICRYLRLLTIDAEYSTCAIMTVICAYIRTKHMLLQRIHCYIHYTPFGIYCTRRYANLLTLLRLCNTILYIVFLHIIYADYVYATSS